MMFLPDEIIELAGGNDSPVNLALRTLESCGFWNVLAEHARDKIVKNWVSDDRRTQIKRLDEHTIEMQLFIAFATVGRALINQRNSTGES